MLRCGPHLYTNYLNGGIQSPLHRNDDIEEPEQGTKLEQHNSIIHESIFECFSESGSGHGNNSELMRMPFDEQFEQVDLLSINQGDANLSGGPDSPHRNLNRSLEKKELKKMSQECDNLEIPKISTLTENQNSRETNHSVLLSSLVETTIDEHLAKNEIVMNSSGQTKLLTNLKSLFPDNLPDASRESDRGQVRLSMKERIVLFKNDEQVYKTLLKKRLFVSHNNYDQMFGTEGCFYDCSFLNN